MCKSSSFSNFLFSVFPWHFGADPDLDPRIRTSDYWTRLLSSVVLRIQKNFRFFSFNIPAGTSSSVLKFKFLLNFSIKFYFASIISVRWTPLWEKWRIRIRSQSRIQTRTLSRISIPLTSDPRDPKEADPDPQHCFFCTEMLVQSWKYFHRRCRHRKKVELIPLTLWNFLLKCNFMYM